MADLDVLEPTPEPALAESRAKTRRVRKTPATYLLRLIALVYLLFLIILPIVIIGWRTFDHGFGSFWTALTQEATTHAMVVTVKVAFFAVVLNTVFGVGVALLLVRRNFPGKRLLNAVIDLPLAVSPVVVGLALVLVYGKLTPIGGWFDRGGIQIIYSTPGMVLATVFVALPLVVRAVVPVLDELGDDQEQAARTLGANGWQTFMRVTIPGIRAALVYGIVLCLARSVGEYGAVAVVSGRLENQTQTLTLVVEDRLNFMDQPGAYAAATLLAFIAVVALIVARLLQPKDGDR